ncbi:MAG TPA: radical SAM protein, partial [Bacteroidota bacterium]|nr:radical SAM protein [Bacteroidota bacterium]
MTKREFLKRCAYCAGGAMVASALPSGMANALRSRSERMAGSEQLWKWSKEALFYRKVDGGLECLKCPNGCILSEGDAGVCRNRINHEGKMYSIAYGNPCAVHIDPIEKKPFFHFLPSTRAFSIAAAGCNFACLNCQNWEISQFSP